MAIAGCGDAGGRSGERLDETSSAVTTETGVDYSWYRPSPSSLVSQGYKFVVRYASYDTTGKNLSKNEADALIAAGLDIVSNWENGSQDALSGYNLGVSDAKAADQQFAADGAPADRPIYFSVDFDATPGDQTAISAYFDGVASVIGLARTGAYGGYYVIQRLFDGGKIKWGWQTYAWSGGQWDSRAQLRQVQNGIAGGQMDEDQSEADDFGQWGHSTPAPPDQPRGYLDQAACTTVSGWTQDPQVPTTSIFADLYYDGPAGASGAHGIRLTANVSRQDLCSAIGSCDHGFSMPLPRSVMDAKAHDVYAYGINHTSGGVNTLLTGSPKTVTCAAPAIPAGTVKRHVVNPTILSAWRFDTFVDMATYTAAEIAAVPSGDDLATAPDIVQASGDPAVYVVDNGNKRHIVSPDSLAAWRLTSADIKPIPAADLAALVAGPDWPVDPLLAKDPSNPSVYMLDVPLSGVASGDGGASSSGSGGAVTSDGGAVGYGDDGGWGSQDTSNGASSGCTMAPTGTPGGAAWLVLAAGAIALATRRRQRYVPAG
jgi:MYXO-CTERM domain-containing protein